MGIIFIQFQFMAIGGVLFRVKSLSSLPACLEAKLWFLFLWTFMNCSYTENERAERCDRGSDGMEAV